MSDQGQMDVLTSTLVDSVQNKEFTANLQKIGDIFSQIDGYIKNLENDSYSVEQYKKKTISFKKERI